MTQSVYLSIIIPAFNAAGILKKNLPVLKLYLKDQVYEYEIILVDDGSNDDGATARISREFGCIYYRNPQNMGKGASVRNGMKIAKGAFRIFTDADIPYEVDVISIILKYLDTKEFDLVIGDRHLKESSYFYHTPWLRRFTSAFFTYFVGTIVTTSFFDTQCGIKGFRAASAEWIFDHARINGFSFDVELIYIALKNTFEIKRIPVRLRNQEKSTVRVLKHGTIMFIDLFKIKYNNLKGYYKTNI
jgi:dolichyl-phosphate beta-glucosyltransferase